jgi:hypothetical protein
MPREIATGAKKLTLTTMKLKLEDILRAFESLKRVPELFRRFFSQYLGNAFEGVDRAIETCKQTVYLEEGFATRWEKMLQPIGCCYRPWLLAKSISMDQGLWPGSATHWVWWLRGSLGSSERAEAPS